DGFTYDASVVVGHNAENKKGNIMFSAGVQSQRPVMAGDRKFSEFDKSFDFANKMQILGGSTSAPGGRPNTTRVDTNGDGKVTSADVRPPLCGAHPASGTDLNQYCTTGSDGNLRPYVNPDDNYNFQPVNYLYTPSDRYNVFSAGNYRLRPEVSAFFEA